MASERGVKHVWRIIRGTQGRVETANLSLVAAGGAFFAMLSVFPGLAAVITLLGFMTDPSILEDQVPLLQEFLPPDAYAILEGQITRMVTANSSTLGWATGVTTLAALWSARKGTDALIRGINAVHGGPIRGGFHGMALSFAMTVALSVLAVLALLTMVVVPIVATVLSLPILAEALPPELVALTSGWALTLIRWVVAFGVVFIGIWALYRFAPNVRRARARVFSGGAILAIVVWGASSLLFTAYLARFGDYSQVYGSIGAVVGLLMFLYLTIYAVLLGAAFDAELNPGAQEPDRVTP